MEWISTEARRRLPGFLHDLYAYRKQEDFTSHIVHSCSDLIQMEACSYNDMRPQQRFAAYKVWPGNYPVISQVAEVLGRYGHQSPLIRHFIQTGDETAYRMSDVCAVRTFRKTDLFNEFYRPLRIIHNLSALIAGSGQALIGMGFHRSTRNFTDQEVALINLIRPHLQQAFTNAMTITGHTDEQAAVDHTIENTMGAVVCVGTGGRIRWESSSAAALLNQFALRRPFRNDCISPLLRAWLTRQQSHWDTSKNVLPPLTPLEIHQGAAVLRIRYLRHAEQHLLILEDQGATRHREALQRTGFSRREIDVLVSVLAGKTNREIGMLLGISSRTVQKHLERLYARLGVENRHAATIALQDLLRKETGTLS